MKKTSECTNCGECCYYMLEGIVKKCKYLIITEKISYCKIFKNRIGTQIDNKVFCMRREQSSCDYPECPNNTGKPLRLLTITRDGRDVKDMSLKEWYRITHERKPNK